MKRLFLSLGLVVLAALTAACSSTAAQPPASAGPVDPNAPGHRRPGQRLLARRRSTSRPTRRSA